MQKLSLLFALTIFAVSSVNAQNSDTIEAAVAEGFANGLHAKYLRYIADKLGVKLNLTTMPFARRVQEIRNGNLDLIVGIQQTEDRKDEFIYVEPYYETLSYRFFTLKENSDKIMHFDDLYQKLVGVNKHSKYFKAFNETDQIYKVDVVSLEQNIHLLLKKRIDALIHYEESTIPTLQRLGVEHLVKKTNYQPDHSNKHYIAISHKSHLTARLAELHLIVRQAIKNGDLMQIRLDHYQQKSAQ